MTWTMGNGLCVNFLPANMITARLVNHECPTRVYHSIHFFTDSITYVYVGNVCVTLDNLHSCLWLSVNGLFLVVLGGGGLFSIGVCIMREKSQSLP